MSAIGPGPGLNEDFDGSSTHLPMRRSASTLGADWASSDGLASRTTAANKDRSIGRMAILPDVAPGGRLVLEGPHARVAHSQLRALLFDQVVSRFRQQVVERVFEGAQG